MDKDIDIEEHDVLDNPALKNLFPDISVIKKEIDRYDSEGSTITVTSNSRQVSVACPQDPTIDSTTLASEVMDLTIDVDCTRTTSEIKDEISLNGDEEPDNFDNFQNNRIILGSKPISGHIKPEETQQYQPNVSIEDLSSYLDTCGLYCSICCILFPDKITYGSHMHAKHVFKKRKHLTQKQLKQKQLKQRIRNRNRPMWRCPVCYKEARHDNLRKHMEQHHYLTWVPKRKPLSRPTIQCIKCNIEIGYDNLKIHLENVHNQIWKQIPAVRCPKCNIEVDYDNLKNHMEFVHKQTWIPNFPFYRALIKRCSICEKEIHINIFKQHMELVHQQTWEPKKTLTKTCPICKVQFQRNYLKKHVLHVHRQQHTELVNKQQHTETKKRHRVCPICKAEVRCDYFKKHINNVHRQQHTKQVHKQQLKPKKRLTRICPICKAELRYDYLKKHVDNVHHQQQTKKGLTRTCPICKVELRFDYLKKHVNNVHRPIYTPVRFQENKNKCIAREDVGKSMKNIKKNVKCEDKFEDHRQQDMFYRCEVCTCYFSSIPLYSKHLTKNHRINREEFKKVRFVPRCQFCSEKVSNYKEYDIHLIAIHPSKYNEKFLDHEETPETESITIVESRCISFALKSTLFKCIQCDIHFLSTKAAMHHTEHMELLINWKCDKCHRIFKKNDEFLHKKQHKLSNKFTVYDLSAPELSRVLYHCSKCTIHFTEDQYLSHYPICGTERPSANYCKICDLLIYEGTFNSHEMIHAQSLNFTTIDTDILTILSDAKSNKNKENNDNNCNSSNKKLKEDHNKDFDLFYCETCECFLNRENHYIHLRKQCANLEKRICNICGLVFSIKCYSKHKVLHLSLGTLKLQDFTFRGVKTRTQVYPPLPKYYKCEYCDVTFISRKALASHDCTDDEYLTCHICESKLSDNAFKLHMSFHNYSVTKMISSQEKTDKPKKYLTKTDHTEQRICNVMLHKLSNIVESKSDSSTSLKSIQDPVDRCSPLKSIKESSIALNQTTNEWKPKNHNVIPGISEKMVSSLLDARTKQHNNNAKTKAKHQSNSETWPIIFSCKNCGLTVDTYDMMIEHCHKHYEGNEMVLDEDTSHCVECDLKFLKTCYESHERLHREKTYFKLLTFDTYYFASDNNVWIKHVFGSIPQFLVDQIVKQSIYRSECRIKLRIIQDGPPHLTVFKCAECQCFIDETVLFKHAENSCFKLRQHPCTICGLPFISSMTRIEHEKLHETLNITAKSYRIVIFNRKEDKKFNGLLYHHKLFILYQCRNCDGVTDKAHIVKHKCDICNLKKCLECGLLLCGAEFDTHIVRHKELPHFNSNNMKVILFGDKADNVEDSSDKMKPSYSGIVYDYTYYCCNQCHVCMRKNEIPSHVCSPVSPKSHCPDCQLYFLTINFKKHRKLHEDREFVQGVVKVIALDPPSPDEKIADSDKNDSESVVVSKELKIAKIYKCECGLHFLDATSIAIHLKSCNPRMKTCIQHCFKCDLLFTPNILFTHLLLHHRNKMFRYTFEIIDMSCNIDVSNILYRCSKCKLNFIEGKDFFVHLGNCGDRNSKGAKCNHCDLLFHEDCYSNHIEKQTSESEQTIYEFKECSIPLEKVDHDLTIKNAVTEYDSEDFANKNNYYGYDSVRKFARTIYKCKKCEIHYLNKLSLIKHIGNKHKVKSKFQDFCNYCGLNFGSVILPRHIKRHHKVLKLNPNDFIIKEY